MNVTAILAVAALSIGGGAGWYFGSGHYQKLYERLQAQDWQTKAQGEEAARKAVEAQLDTLTDTLTTNAKVIHGLQENNRAIAADSGTVRDQLRRLRGAQTARSCPAGGAVPEIDHRPSVAGPSRDAGDEQFPEVVGNLVDECKRNAQRLDALIAEILPQL